MANYEISVCPNFFFLVFSLCFAAFLVFGEQVISVGLLSDFYDCQSPKTKNLKASFVYFCFFTFLVLLLDQQQCLITLST